MCGEVGGTERRDYIAEDSFDLRAIRHLLRRPLPARRAGRPLGVLAGRVGEHPFCPDCAALEFAQRADV